MTLRALCRPIVACLMLTALACGTLGCPPDSHDHDHDHGHDHDHDHEKK